MAEDAFASMVAQLVETSLARLCLDAYGNGFSPGFSTACRDHQSIAKRCGAQQVSAQRDEGIHLSVDQAFHRIDNCHSVLMGRREVEHLCNRSSGTRCAVSASPTERWPCTLECPRTGQHPAPSRPMFPRSSKRFTSIAMSRAPYRLDHHLAQAKDRRDIPPDFT